MNKQYIRRPLISDAPAEFQMAWAGYLHSGGDLVPFETWLDWRKHGSGRASDWIIGKGSVPPAPTTRSNS